MEAGEWGLPEVEEEEEGIGVLPEHACAFCGIHNPACVVRCNATGKWFCNSRANSLPASCVVYHLIRSKHKAVTLHRDSPLGEMTLECYLTGTRNVFQLGFLPAKADNTVVLLSRDVANSQHASSLDLDLDLSQWEPLVQDRVFLSWLVAFPSERVRLPSPITKPPPPFAFPHLLFICPLIRSNFAPAKSPPPKPTSSRSCGKTIPMPPSCVLLLLPLRHPAIFIYCLPSQQADVEERVEEDEPQPVALRYADAYQYQNIFAPLLKMEADYDKALKESQTRHGITVRWEMGLNRKRVAYFVFPSDESEVHLVPGDELRLSHVHTQPDGKRIQWECTGQVIRLTANVNPLTSRLCNACVYTSIASRPIPSLFLFSRRRRKLGWR
jgi:regulator of nonsense transcripts 1